MFEVLDRAALAELSDEALISAVTRVTHNEASVAAYRLALIGEVVARQCDDEDDTVAHQVIDGWAWAQAAVAAACNLNPYAASKQMRIAQALRDRLPRTAALFATGAISATVIDAITWRTHLVVDEDALGLIDAAIAGEAGEYGAHSEKHLIGAVDLWVEKFDPDAVVRSKRAAKDLYVEFDDKDDPNGVASFWGRLRITDKKILEQRLDALADTVCPHDPRRRGELRAAALAALGAVGPQLERLTCECGDVNCAGSGKDPRAGAITIYALTDQIPAAGEDTPPQITPGSAGTPGSEPAATEAAPEQQERTAEHEPQTPAAESAPVGPSEPAEPAARNEPIAPAARTEPAEASSEPAPAAANARPAAPAACNPSPGVMLDGAIIPAAMLAELVAAGATVKPLADIANLPIERQYRPSAALTAFVRMRAMTCSFPGCNRAAHRCDLDHLIPWPAGATHPGNLAPLCRLHHLVKTFGGWTPTAQPDGTTHWTAPTGHTYEKAPGAAILFPHWNIETPIPRKRAISLINDTDRDTTAAHQKAMPTRTRTRAQDRAQRITTERTHNQLQRALERADSESNSDPPF